MYRFLLVIALIGSLTIGSVVTVFAQDATPVANPPATGADPAVGDSVPYIGSDGQEWARVTVEEVIDPFDDYDASSGAPDRGNRWVALRITVEDTGSKAVEVSSFDFIVQDDQGFLYGNSFISRTEEQEAAEPEFEDANLAPGDSVTGLLFFQVVDDAQLSHIFWEPDSGRLVTLANVAA